MLIKNTTRHEKRFPIPGGGEKRDEIVFPAGAVVEVSDGEADALGRSRVAGAWFAAGELSHFTPATKVASAESPADTTGGAELDEKKDA